MKLKFKQQKYQDDAVNSIVSCFKGEIKDVKKTLFNRYNKIFEKDTLFEKKEIVDVISFGNHSITLSDSDRRKNIREVQRKNDISFTENAGLDNFSIEMETGTGKTFTYIKSMYELNKEYGWSKFIIMTPSIAIREGVLKTFKVTEDYFQELYHKKIRYFVYNSLDTSNIANINSFVSDDSIWVMIINYQAFNAKGVANRKIYEELDELQSNKPIDIIKSVRPILIVDEPQKFGDKTEELFKEFNPLFIVRYSATHKKNKEYNKIYRLDAIDAYNQKLVKKINVKGIELINNKSENTYLFLENIDVSKKNAPVANMEIEVKTKSGIKRVLKKIHINDDLYELSNKIASYKGYKVLEIDARNEEYDQVEFVNGIVIKSGQAMGDIDSQYIIRIQIRETIKSHLLKEKELYNKGIKVLSLFFIDKVANYKEYDQNNNIIKGEYAKIFEQEYLEALNEYLEIDDDYSKYLKSFKVNEVHSGYFSIDKKGHLVDSKVKDKKEYISDDEDAYNLIMRDKERLLSINEPVRFIFSHSALREGWDNPNIFQICTLKHSNSEISKRQEIGRGLRIAVDNSGERMDSSVLEEEFHDVNTLTVVASESYDSFAKSLQKDMLETITSRPKNFSQDYFVGKELVNNLGDKYKFTEQSFMDLLFFNVEKGYIDRLNGYKVTDKFISQLEVDKVEVLEEIKPFKEQFCDLMKKMYLTSHTNFITDERKKNITTLKPNKNFNKKEFRDLWNKINVKTVYEVNFDSSLLIDKAIKSINDSLQINKMKIRIKEGSQKDQIDTVSIISGESMKETTNKIQSTTLEFTPSSIKYDLIGEIADKTELTRHTIIEILSKISTSKFEMYKYNPEEFIRKVINIINIDKATTIIDGITYHKTDEKYSDDIFNLHVSGELGKNAIEVNKNIYDYLIADSTVEINFAKELETGEVLLYAKLPSNYKIPTPVGNYNPDWLIIFDNKKFKYNCFIAETKGDLDNIQLREIEKLKIACARKHFSLLTNDKVGYDVVDNYETLMNYVLKN